MLIRSLQPEANTSPVSQWLRNDKSNQGKRVNMCCQYQAFCRDHYTIELLSPCLLTEACDLLVSLKPKLTPTKLREVARKSIFVHDNSRGPPHLALPLYLPRTSSTFQRFRPLPQSRLKGSPSPPIMHFEGVVIETLEDSMAWNPCSMEGLIALQGARFQSSSTPPFSVKKVTVKKLRISKSCFLLFLKTDCIDFYWKTLRNLKVWPKLLHFLTHLKGVLDLALSKSRLPHTSFVCPKEHRSKTFLSGLNLRLAILDLNQVQLDSSWSIIIK